MAKAVTIYGIKNCDTMKKARAWLDDRGVAYGFHDYKSAGVDRGTLDRWARATGWETLLNRAGTTFRKLPDKDKEGLTEKKAIALMLAQPSMIKRPVLDIGGKLLWGSSPSNTPRHSAAKQYSPSFRGAPPKSALADLGSIERRRPRTLAHALEQLVGDRIGGAGGQPAFEPRLQSESMALSAALTVRGVSSSNLLDSQHIRD